MRTLSTNELSNIAGGLTFILEEEYYPQPAPMFFVSDPYAPVFYDYGFGPSVVYDYGPSVMYVDQGPYYYDQSYVVFEF